MFWGHRRVLQTWRLPAVGSLYPSERKFATKVTKKLCNRSSWQRGEAIAQLVISPRNWRAEPERASGPFQIAYFA
jgi:hypothetical protein